MKNVKKNTFANGSLIVKKLLENFKEILLIHKTKKTYF